MISKETKEKCYQGYLEVKINTSNNPTFIDGMEAAEKILDKEIKITEEALELLGGHHPQCTCFCMEHRAIYKDTIENLKQLRGEK